jgi:hypothetical protein
MRTTNEVSVKPPKPGLGLIVSVGLLSLLAAAVAYVGFAVAVTLTMANGDARALAAGTTYALIAFGAPIVCGIYLARRRGWSRLRAVRFAAVALLVVHAPLLPVALAALSM